MFKTLISRSASLLPQAAGGHLGWLRGAVGGALAIAMAGVLTMLAPGPEGGGFPLLVAPMGASAVLVFVVPASPLAQPWSVIGGHLLSAGIGRAVGHALGAPVLAGAIAVGTAIVAMSLARCLHPPGGACALLCALGAAGPEAWGWAYLWPIALNVAAMAGTGWLYNNLTGHPWPHRAALPSGPPPAPALDYTHADIEAVLAEWNEVLDVDVNDLDAFYRALQRHVASERAAR